MLNKDFNFLKESTTNFKAFIFKRYLRKFIYMREQAEIIHSSEIFMIRTLRI